MVAPVDEWFKFRYRCRVRRDGLAVSPYYFRVNLLLVCCYFVRNSSLGLNPQPTMWPVTGWIQTTIKKGRRSDPKAVTRHFLFSEISNHDQDQDVDRRKKYQRFYDQVTGFGVDGFAQVHQFCATIAA